jgi:menaquinol-cytochrome c reductase iron-sulfur subunit
VNILAAPSVRRRNNMQKINEPSNPERREFCKKACSVGISGVLGLVPAAAGVAVLLDPLQRKTQATGAINVATLDALPADGVPKKFEVLASRTDAWNKFSRVIVGAVYLRRTADDKLQAFNVICPHAGCFVDYLTEKGSFLCPCHNSTFTIEGRIADQNSPSARGLDELKVEIRKNKEVWVEFQNFQAGHAEKIPVA